MRIQNVGSLVGLLTLGAGVAVQAAPITLSPTANYIADRSWQEIKGTAYSFADANGNNLLEVGETVTFTVTMAKANWGVHDYDALKVWIDQTPYNPSTSALYTQNFVWDFDPDDSNMWSDTWYGRDVSYKPWTGGTKSFSFSYTFADAGVYDLTASVMCSADLSGLVGWADGNPTAADWNAWTRTVHGPNGSQVYQGETEKYKLTVYTPVPEPGTLALMGLGLLGVLYFRRKKKTA